MKFLLVLSILGTTLFGASSVLAQNKTEQVTTSTVDLFSESRKFLNDVQQLAEANFNDGMYKKFISRINADIKKSEALAKDASSDDQANYRNTIKKMNDYLILVEKELNNKSKKTKASLIKSINTYLSL